MRVAHVITRLIVGGAQENTLLTVQDQQRDYGDEVALITGPGLGPEGSLEEEARSSGVDVRLVPAMRRSLHPWRDWVSYRSVLKLLREYRPEIVHTHSSKAGILGRRAAWVLGVPCVHTIHGAAFHYGQKPAAYRAYVAAERLAARWTDHFISVADAMTAEYLRAGVGEESRYTTIYSGFDVQPFLNPPVAPSAVRERLGLSPDHVVVGMIARLFPLKGHEFLLRAASTIAAAAPQVRFLLVGDGVLRPSMETEIRRMGLDDRFVFAGLVSPAQVPELIAAIDVVVHTSQWEGLARVLPQALIAGKPVVSYDVGGAREVVIRGETGFLLPRDCVTELAEAVLQLASQPALRDRLGRRGRELFTDRFRHQTMTRRIREVYADVLSRRAGRSGRAVSPATP